MASFVQMDLASIANPIPGDNPAGVDLRQSDSLENDFRAVKDAREQARKIERRAEIDPDEGGGALAYWETVRDLGGQVLCEQSKDLEIAAYMIEAMLRTDGYAGMAQALAVTRTLVENFWEVLFPQPSEEDGLESRTLPLSRLNGTESEGILIGPIGRVLITEGSTTGPYALWHHKQMQDLAKCSEHEQQARLDRGGVSQDKFNQAVAETSGSFFVGTVASLENCQK